MVRIYRWNATSESWRLIPSSIQGELRGDRAGFALSVAGDGGAVAVGLPYGAGNVRIYAINGDAVTKLGADIAGFGAYSVSLSSAPIYRVAIGSPFASSSAGEITVHAWDGFAGTWNQENTATMTGSITGSSLAAAELVTRYPRAPLAVGSTDAVSSASTLLDGLLAWYEFDGDLSDSSGNGRTLTQTGGATLVSNNVRVGSGSGYLPGGVANEWFGVPQTPTLNFGAGTEITFCTWFNFVSIGLFKRIFDFGAGQAIGQHHDLYRRSWRGPAPRVQRG
jgi:hypothetical protein